MMGVAGAEHAAPQKEKREPFEVQGKPVSRTPNGVIYKNKYSKVNGKSQGEDRAILGPQNHKIRRLM